MRMKKIIIIISVSVAALVLAVAVFVFGLFSFLNKEQSKDFYTLGNDNIPSLTYVAGKQKLHGYSFNVSNGEQSKEYRYRTSKGVEDGNLYTLYLVEEEGFERQESSGGMVFYRKPSSDSGMLLEVTVYVSSNSMVITVRKTASVTGWVNNKQILSCN